MKTPSITHVFLKAAIAVCLLAPLSSARAEWVEEATSIVSKGLIGNIATVDQKQYLLAGRHQFHSLWAWDFCFASLGALKAGQQKAVHDSLEAYFSNQKPTGELPRIIDNQNVQTRVVVGILGSALGFDSEFKAPLLPWFDTENGVKAVIPNIILPWTAWRYVEFTHDLEFARKWFKPAQTAVRYLESVYLEGGLIGKQPPYSDWEDSVQRTGKVAFTNEIYILALKALSSWAALLDESELTRTYAERAAQAQSRFYQVFWDSTHQRILNFEGDDHLTADANLMAVVFGLVPRPEAEAIMKTVRGSPLWFPIPGRATWPNYPDSLKDLTVRVIGLGGYHDEIYWLWLSVMGVMAERALGDEQAAQDLLVSISKQIVGDGVLSEVFDLQNDRTTLKPVQRLLYRSEAPFTWSSGLFLEAAIR